MSAVKDKFSKIKEKFNKIEITRRERILWIVMFVFSLMGMCDIPGNSIYSIALWLQWCAMIAISTLKSVLLVVLIELSKKWRATYVIAWFIIGIYIVLCVANLVCFTLYDFGISHRMIIIFAQTNQSEIIEFLPGFLGNIASSILSLRTLLCIVSILILSVIVLKSGSKSLCIGTGIMSLVGIVVFIMSITSVPQGRNSFIMLVRAPKTIVEAIREIRNTEAILESLQPYQNAARVKSAHKAVVVVMIIGESASKGHLSLYGYPLATTPGMEAMGNQIIAFSNAIGSSTGTAANMERILTMKRDTDTDSWVNYPMAMDIFKAGGYKTYWLSNQERSGLYGNGSGVIAMRADRVCYIGKISSEDALLQKYDEALLPEFDKILSDTAANSKFIGINLMGSHTMYKLRYPSNRERFTGEDVERINHKPWLTKSKYQTIAEYDNSILYTDYIVCAMIKRVSNLNTPAIVVYFSDHGENVYDDRDFLGRDPKFVEVPFIVYTNEKYRQANPEMIRTLNSVRSRRISTANTLYPILTMTGTYCPEYDNTYDFLSPAYIERPRYVDEKMWIGDRR